ncbi:MAG TPA: TIGR00282 family metallophosphoesterase [Candidatus Saccharimonadales bacterium]|nr:TIGR00282 family metallophosphoesterase [Candidatus Saccharimonadales bacterium]
MKILFIGDIVASPGRDAVKEVLPKLKKETGADFVIANAENLAHGRGATEETVHEMMNAGVNYFTGGDHLFWHPGFEDVVDSLPVIRPANYPNPFPGNGSVIIDLKEHGNLLLVNLMGRTSFGGQNSYLNDPFRTIDSILEQVKDKNIAISIVDFHAEATSEKAALGFYLDGRVTAVVGTHTHIPTCDNRLLPKGTMFVSDIGMTGNIDSVLGVKKEIIIKQFLTASNQKFEWESTGNKAFRSVLLDISNKVITRFDLNI